MFCLSFAAVPAFAVIVLMGFPVQTITAFVRGIDIAAWLSIMAIALRKRTRDRALFSLIFALTGVLALIPATPSLFVSAARTLALIAYSVERWQASQCNAIVLADQGPANIHDIANRFGLSPRETEVLILLVKGKRNNEIADELFISLSTVKTHIASIFEKTGARNRVEVSALCKKK